MTKKMAWPTTFGKSVFKVYVDKDITIKENVDIKMKVDLDFNGDNKALATADATAGFGGTFAGSMTNTMTDEWTSLSSSQSLAENVFTGQAQGSADATAYGDGTFSDAETVASWSHLGLSSASFSQSATDYS